MPVNKIDWHFTAISYFTRHIGKYMLRLFMILFLLFVVNGQVKASEIIMRFGPNMEKLSLPDD